MTTVESNARLDNLEDIYQLAPMQQGMLFHTLYSPDSGVYVEQSLFTIKGELDVSAFQSAWQKVVDRHSILRTSFVWEAIEQPQQVVMRSAQVPFEKHDWSDLPTIDQEKKLNDYLADDRARGFELGSPPLLRIALFRLGPELHQFVFSRHHLVLDRWSRALLLKEVFALYQGFANGVEPALNPTRDYGEYIAWLDKQDKGAAEQYWRSRLQSLRASTGFAVDRSPESRSESADYGSERIFLSPESTEKLKAFAREHKLTLNILAQGAWALLLSRYSGDNDVVFGVTVSGRPASLVGVETMVGLFINTVPARVSVVAETPVATWLQQLQDEQIQLQQFEHSSLVEIQSLTQVPRGQRLFESIFVFENLPVAGSYQAPASALEFVEERGLGSTTGYPLTVLVSPGTRMAVQMVYDRSRFDAETVRRMLGHYECLLEGLLANESMPLSQIEILTSEEREQLRAWNQTNVAWDASETVVNRFEAQVEKNKALPAVIFESESLNYEQLNAAANRLANYLRSRDVGPEKRVAICLERGLAMVVGVLATLKAGAAYVPVDPAYPTERVRFMFADSQCSVVLTSAALARSLPQTESLVVRLDEEAEAIERESAADLHADINGENLAYVIYTSGSTGRPKGVAMTHRALSNLMQWQLQPPFAAARTLQFSSLSFDVSFQELFSTWCSGGALILVGDEIRRDPAATLKFLRAQHVERIFLPFVYLQHLAEAVEQTDLLPEELREVITAGEQLEITPQIARWFGRLNGCSLYNHYGPSETHVVTGYKLAGPISDWPGLPPIGKAISNTQIYIVDRNLAHTPIGVPGELLIGGTNVSRGYLERADVTAERYVPDPFGQKAGARLYRTGDLARYRADGNIEFLGRIDSQVKIRGFRIEVGEIQAVLLEHAAVRQAVVIARDNGGGKELIAYVVAEGKREGITRQLREHLKARLPDYMAPADFVFLDVLPVTPSGKVDRRALPDPERNTSDRFQAPETPEQAQLAEIWSTVLRRTPIGIFDNFFELGGHSLLATQLISRVNLAFRVELPLRCLFDSPTIAELADTLKLHIQTAGVSEPQTIARHSGENAGELLAKIDTLSDAEVEALLHDLLAESN